MKESLDDKLKKLDIAIANKRSLVESLEKEAVQLENIRNCHKEIEEFTEQTCRKYGIRLEDLTTLQCVSNLLEPETKKKYSTTLRYKHPLTAQVWSGNGKTPHWFKLQDADSYLMEGQSHTMSIKARLEEMKEIEKQKNALTKEHAAKLKNMAIGWQKIFDRGIEKTIKNQWLAELEKQTPHIHYVETFVSKELAQKLKQWEADSDY